ncbi:polysaccharide deacetylase [Allosphingosinicella sp.]|uniref:polysaccharide deacetylase n=1 Tax=Allosphingosinicella sp. TaxID=2823234 RepID=UPI002FC26EC5
MDCRVLLTVDTELTWGHHVRGCSWRENFARSYEAAGVGIPWQLRTLAEHRLKACFFVDPMPALVHGIEPIRRMVRPILDAGQEVQLHLHSFWHDLAEGRDKPRFELTDFDAAGQHDLIRTARDLLIEAGAPDPIAFRSGSYAADESTLGALAELGIRYDSSHNGSHHPWPSALPLDPAQIAPLRQGVVVEIPVAQMEDRAGKLRHLQLCAISAEELRQALLHAARHGHPLTTLVSHSFELATRDGLRPNRTLCRRFERLCAFLAGERDRLSTVHFADLDDLPLGASAVPMPASKLRRARRMAQQIWSNAVYERAL